MKGIGSDISTKSEKKLLLTKMEQIFSRSLIIYEIHYFRRYVDKKLYKQVANCIPWYSYACNPAEHRFSTQLQFFIVQQTNIA